MTDSLLGNVGGPLSRLSLVSALQILKQGDPQETGARNLLAKAKRCLEAEDAARADALILRASALRSSRTGEGDTARIAANAMLFDAVIDAVETSEDDHWLDRALDLWAECDGVAASELAYVLQVAMQDWDLGKSADRRITAAFGRLDERDSWERQDLDLPTDLDAVRQILWTVIRYQRC